MLRPVFIVGFDLIQRKLLLQLQRFLLIQWLNLKKRSLCHKVLPVLLMYHINTFHFTFGLYFRGLHSMNFFCYFIKHLVSNYINISLLNYLFQFLGYYCITNPINHSVRIFYPFYFHIFYSIALKLNSIKKNIVSK